MQNKKIALILALALVVQCFVVTGLAGAVGGQITGVDVNHSAGKESKEYPTETSPVDLQAVQDTDEVYSVTITGSSDCTKLEVTSLTSARLGSINYRRMFNFTSNKVTVAVSDLLPGIDSGSMQSLRNVFGAEVTVKGNLHTGGGATPAFAVKLRLAGTTTINNEWANLTFDQTGKKMTAQIKASVLNDNLAALKGIGIIELVLEAAGQLPAQASANGTIWRDPLLELSELRADIVSALGVLSWAEAKFTHLVGKTMYFTLDDGGATYSIVFTKEASTPPPGPGPGPVDPGGGGGGTNEPPVVAKPIETEEGKTVHEVRATAGLIPDIVIAKSKGQTSLTIDVTAALPKDAEVEALTVQIPKDIVKSLAGLEVVLDTPYGGLALPKALVEALAAAGEEIALTIQPGRPEAVQAEIAERDELLTEPVEITTSIRGSTIVTLPCNLPLSTDAEEREAFLASLYILAIHGEEDVEQIGELTLNIDEETGTLLSISFQVDRFSTFALVATGTEPEAPKSKLYTAIDAKTYVINDDIKAFDNVTSYRANGETTVMAVRLLQELGAQIGYKRVDNVGVVTVIYGDTTATLREKSNVMTVVDATGTRQVTLRTVFTNLNGRTYLPTRDVAENLGFFVHWVAQDDSITISGK